jgi:hypothetical protein
VNPDTPWRLGHRLQARRPARDTGCHGEEALAWALPAVESETTVLNGHTFANPADGTRCGACATVNPAHDCSVVVRRCPTTDPGHGSSRAQPFGLARIAEHPACVCGALY